MCPLKTISLAKVQGQILTIPDAPLAGTRIDIERLGKPDTLVGSTSTDDKGFFAFNDLKKGKYRLIVHIMVNGIESLPSYPVIVNVRKSNVRENRKHVKITISSDCAENVVEVVDDCAENVVQVGF